MNLIEWRIVNEDIVADGAVVDEALAREVAALIDREIEACITAMITGRPVKVAESTYYVPGRYIDERTGEWKPHTEVRRQNFGGVLYGVCS